MSCIKQTNKFLSLNVTGSLQVKSNVKWVLGGRGRTGPLGVKRVGERTSTPSLFRMVNFFIKEYIFLKFSVNEVSSESPKLGDEVPKIGGRGPQTKQSFWFFGQRFPVLGDFDGDFRKRLRGPRPSFRDMGTVLEMGTWTQPLRTGTPATQIKIYTT